MDKKTYNDIQEKIEDAKLVLRSRKSKSDREHNDQEKKNKERLTLHKKLQIWQWELLKPGGDLRCSEEVNSSYSTNSTRQCTRVNNPVTYSLFVKSYGSHISVQL